jgi:hypothetical protein
MKRFMVVSARNTKRNWLPSPRFGERGRGKRGFRRNSLRHHSRCFPNGLPPHPQPFSPAKPLRQAQGFAGEKGAKDSGSDHPTETLQNSTMNAFSSAQDAAPLKPILRSVSRTMDCRSDIPPIVR